MGKGDKKSKRGKIVNKSYGVRRKRKDETFKVDVNKIEKPAAEAKVVKVETEVKPKPKAKAKPKADS
jgi:30S ribosomal protein S31